MKIDSIRIYSEVLEQGLDFKSYIQKSGYNGTTQNVYTHKNRECFSDNDSLIDRIRKVKDVDVLISVISDNKEYPMLMVEYSTAVPTDDHKMQRSDVYFWSSVFRVPIMKISPSTKGMNQDFGGGSKFNDDIERIVAYNKGALFYPIKWENNGNTDVLKTDDNYILCIHYSDEIKNIVTNLLSTLKSIEKYEEYYINLKNGYSTTYAKELSLYSQQQIQDVIVNSSRFQKENGKVCVKINRFGHAMDPDRGVLYFINMLIGAENTLTEIQINRPADFSARAGYNSLFHLTSREYLLKEYVKNIIKNKSNIFSDEDSIYIFLQALNIDNLMCFKKISEAEYIIEDSVLYKFLTECTSMVSKSIFYLSTELRLTDINRDVICTIKWNPEVVRMFLDSVSIKNYSPLEIKDFENKYVTEDIVTFASVELHKRIGCNMLAVSYPGAQGDRCILTGHGRTVLRTFVDLIAYKELKDGMVVCLEECKDKMNKCGPDVKKLNQICANKEYEIGLKNMFEKILNCSDIKHIYKSIGAKNSACVPYTDVDYIFMFGIRNTEAKTLIDYTVEVKNTELFSELMNLSQDNKKLSGTIELDKIYCI